MKKILLTLFALLLISQCGISCKAAETTNIFTSLKNAIIKDVQDTVTSTVNSTLTTAANKALNVVKLNQYKQQLAQKQQELADLEASNKNFIVKFFKRRSINKEIKDLEIKIMLC